MRHDSIHSSILATAMVALSITTATARADSVLYTQPYDDQSAGVASQIFTDNPPNYTNWNTQAFDDFTVPAGPGWSVTGATFYGQELGDPTQNVSVNMQILTAPGFTTSGISGGTEDSNGNLDFDNLDIYLAPGTYWITGWVDRPELTGGQWYWDMTNVGDPIGSEFYIQNPGGGMINDGYGNALAAAPTPGSEVFGDPPSDLAFTLYGQAVAEPSGLVMLAIGCVAVIFLAWRSWSWPSRIPARGTS